MGCWLLTKWACPIQWLCRNEVMAQGGFVIHGTHYQVRALGDKNGKKLYFSTETKVWWSDVSFHTVTGPLSLEGNLDPVPQPPFTPPPFAFVTCGYAKFCVCFCVSFHPAVYPVGAKCLPGERASYLSLTWPSSICPVCLSIPWSPAVLQTFSGRLPLPVLRGSRQQELMNPPGLGECVIYFRNRCLQKKKKKKSLLREVREVLRCLKNS